VSVQRRPVHRGVACAARSWGVAAAVAEARLVPYDDLAGAELAPVGASHRRLGDPHPARGLN
jgi:hypothetical protein